MSPGPSVLGCETVGLCPGASTAPLMETKRFEAAGGLDGCGVPLPAAASRSASWMDEPGRKPDGQFANAGAGCAVPSPIGWGASPPCSSAKASGTSGAGAATGGKLRGIARRYVSRGRRAENRVGCRSRGLLLQVRVGDAAPCKRSRDQCTRF